MDKELILEKDGLQVFKQLHPENYVLIFCFPEPGAYRSFAYISDSSFSPEEIKQMDLEYARIVIMASKDHFNLKGMVKKNKNEEGVLLTRAYCYLEGKWGWRNLEVL
jgi:hypothetical protein